MLWLGGCCSVSRPEPADKGPTTVQVLVNNSDVGSSSPKTPKACKSSFKKSCGSEAEQILAAVERAGQGSGIVRSVVVTHGSVPLQEANLPSWFPPSRVSSTALDDLGSITSCQGACPSPKPLMGFSKRCLAALVPMHPRPRWLGVTGEDWALISVADPATDKVSQEVGARTEVKADWRVFFACAERSTVSGVISSAVSEARSRKVIERMRVGDHLDEDITICRDDHIHKGGGRVNVAGDTHYRVLKGAKLLEFKDDRCTFEYEPIHRLRHNLANVREATEKLELDFFRFKAELVAPHKRLGLNQGGVPGLDLRAKYGINALGIARSEGKTWSIEWCPKPNVLIGPGDVCIVAKMSSSLLETVKQLSE